ncbi:hypothetical protein ACROYT_G016471 [Oculina patagonica]
MKETNRLYGNASRSFYRILRWMRVVGRIGRNSSFEVTVNGKLIFSKLETGSFPSFKEVVSVVLDCSQGKEAHQVTEKEEGCILL